jgi:hypothetical protein
LDSAVELDADLSWTQQLSWMQILSY